MRKRIIRTLCMINFYIIVSTCGAIMIDFFIYNSLVNLLVVLTLILIFIVFIMTIEVGIKCLFR